MPLTIPNLDDRRYQQLLDEALARIPVHNPEWTNFNKSDPGVTLIEIFAFLTENLLYRANQIPERNRRKFLTLLDVPLQPGASARGVVTFTNERGPLQTITLNKDVEVFAGQVPFRTEKGLDVLPIMAQAYYKQRLQNPDPQLSKYYRELYISFTGSPLPDTPEPLLYETRPLAPRPNEAIAFSATVDGALWIALLLRPDDKPDEQNREAAREALAGKTLSLGIVPALTDVSRRLPPGGKTDADNLARLTYEIPKLSDTGGLADANNRQPKYQTLVQTGVPSEPVVVEIPLPQDSKMLRLWNNVDPLEAGVGQMPPSLEDTNLSERVITWLRMSVSGSTQVQGSAELQLLWAGVNAAFVQQRAHVANELLPEGTGEPDQVVTLAKTPIIPGSVRLTVTENKVEEPWLEIDDLLSAGPEVPVPDLREPPGLAPQINPLVKIFTVNPESGEIRFGDGARGKRPALGASLRADYDYGVGPAGNVGPGAINSSPALPASLKVNNAVRTWGGAEAETVVFGEKQIARYLQHRERLVNATDFETITLRTPGVDIGRVDVIPAYNPELKESEPGDAPGAVTLMIIPKYDPGQPDAPRPDRFLLDTICHYLDSRRLVTTEVFLRGPSYQSIWISLGLNIVSGFSAAEVREAVQKAVREFLAPLPKIQTSAPSLSAQCCSPDQSCASPDLLDRQAAMLTTPQFAELQKGWPLRKAVVAREILTVASRVQGVAAVVQDVFLAKGEADATEVIAMNGLELPRIVGLSVVVGEPVDLKGLRGQISATTGTTQGPKVIPVPVIPEECK